MVKDEEFFERDSVTNEKGLDKSREITTSYFLDIINSNRIPFALLLIGVTLIGVGVFYLKLQDMNKSDEIVLLEEDVSELDKNISIIVEIAGAVTKPGV